MCTTPSDTPPLTADELTAARALIVAACQAISGHDTFGTALVTEVAAVVDEQREQELALLRRIVGSEAFRFLISGQAARPDAHRLTLRPLYERWSEEYQPH